jgi:plasmid stability protein
MATLTIRELDASVEEQLRARAAEHGRSVEEEAREILRSAVAKPEGEPENLYVAMRRRLREAGIEGIDLPDVPRELMPEPPHFD